MIEFLANRTYPHPLPARVIARMGTGLLTVALGLLAFELAGERAGAVLGTALAIKMIAYVGVAPIVGGFADRLPRYAIFSALSDAALNDLLLISRHGRDRLVVLDIGLYRELMAEALAPQENGEAGDLQGRLQRLGTNEP